MNKKYRVTVVNMPPNLAERVGELKLLKSFGLALADNSSAGGELAKYIADKLPYILLDGVSLEKADVAIEALAKVKVTAKKEESNYPNPVCGSIRAIQVYEDTLLRGLRPKKG